jgi:hypothetical protein
MRLFRCGLRHLPADDSLPWGERDHGCAGWDGVCFAVGRWLACLVGGDLVLKQNGGPRYDVGSD